MATRDILIGVVVAVVLGVAVWIYGVNTEPSESLAMTPSERSDVAAMCDAAITLADATVTTVAGHGSCTDVATWYWSSGCTADQARRHLASVLERGAIPRSDGVFEYCDIVDHDVSVPHEHPHPEAPES